MDAKRSLRASLTLAVLGVGVATYATAAPDGGPALDELRGLIHAGRYAEAESQARLVLAEVESARGAESLEAAGVLDLLVEALWRGGKAKDAQTHELAERAVATYESLLGPDDPKVATSLRNLAEVYTRGGRLRDAKPLYERALSILERAPTPQDAEIATTLSAQGVMFWYFGDLDAAGDRFSRALEIQQEVLRPDHPDVGKSLNNLGLVAMQRGDYLRAREYLERAATVREKALGPDHPELAGTLNNFGIMLFRTGDYDRAGQVFERALAIMEKTIGPDHPHYRSLLISYGGFLYVAGDYARARTVNERTLALIGEGGSGRATVLANQGLVLWAQGDYAAARSVLEESLEIREKAYGPEHASVAESLGNLGALLRAIGDYAGAEAHLRRALAINEKAWGLEHPSVARSLGKLADLLSKGGQYAVALETYERARGIYESVFGTTHPHVAETLVGLGGVHWSTGEPAVAESLYRRAQAIQQETLGPDHPALAHTWNRLASLQYELGRPAEATQAALRAEQIGREHLRVTSRTLAEPQALRYAAARTSAVDLLATLAAQGLDRVSLREVWDAVIRSRAVVLDEMASRHRTVGTTADPEIERLAAELASARTRLANLLVRGVERDEPERYRELIAAARLEVERSERNLGKRSASFRREDVRGRIGLQEVASVLPAGSALVAYLKYEHQARAEEPAKRVGPAVPSYLALVLREGATAPVAVPLDSAARIEPRIAGWRAEVDAKPGGLRSARRQAEADYLEAGSALRRALWDSLTKHLGDPAQVFVVPDGAINLVSLATLPVEGERFLVEAGPTLHYLSAERDLVRPAPSEPAGSSLLVLGGADFDTTPNPVGIPRLELARADPRTAPAVAGEVYRGPHASCDDFGSFRFKPLRASLDEVEEIASLWSGGAGNEPKVVRLTGAAAAETLFKRSAPGHRVIHLATHGFFLDDRCLSALGGTGARGAVGVEPEPLPVAGDNPLLLTGLALAGANRRAEVGAGQEDGILTAEEIASLNLTGVEWAVLSACDTGVGRVLAGEGVFGLRRAFETAGVGTLIMSLWSVQDEATRAWMRELYGARLRGRSSAEAVREASLRVLRARRKAGLSTHPFFWGAFVAAGDWR